MNSFLSIAWWHCKKKLKNKDYKQTFLIHNSHSNYDDAVLNVCFQFVSTLVIKSHGENKLAHLENAWSSTIAV